MTRAWVEVDLGALRHNGAALAACAGVPLLPMVKADGYGLGAVQIARALEPLAPWGYGVATVREGVELRDAGIERPILVCTPLLSDDLDAAAAARLTPSLARAGDIERWARFGLPWHLPVDTGMSRSGIRWDALHGLLPALGDAAPEGAYTHFHSADRNDGSMEVQERRFAEAVARLPARPPLVHCENGAAIARRGRSRWDLVRPGIFLYGAGGGEGAHLAPRPVAHLRARVVDLRTVEDGETVSYCATYRAVGQRRIATVAVGYGDGYRRALSNRGTALLRGRPAPVAGLVTMDMTMLDVTDVPCEIGDVATLLGRDGEALLAVDSVAQTADLSPYELLTGLRGRLPRVYVETAA